MLNVVTDFDPKVFRRRMSRETAARLGQDACDAIAAAHEVGALWIVHNIAKDHGGTICGFCLTDILRLSWLTTGEAIRLGPCIACDACFSRLYGMSIYDYKLKEMRATRRR